MQGDDLAVAAAAAVPVAEEKVEEPEEKHQQQHEEAAVSVCFLWVFWVLLAGLALLLAPFWVLGEVVGVCFDAVQYWHLCVGNECAMGVLDPSFFLLV